MREIIVPLTVGIILFLFGLHLMRIGLNNLAKDKLNKILLKFTNSTTKGFFTGICSTALLQSSTAVTVLVIGFVNAGTMAFSNSIGIILGTNIGTTVTTEIMALNIEDLAIPLVVIGAILWVIPYKNCAPLGLSIGGFGCIFLGMKVMHFLIEPLKANGYISWFMESTDYPVLAGLLAGAVLTALVHSSSAVIVITMNFLSAGLLTMPFSLAVVLGSNIGTCITALIASIGATIGAKQVALSHVILNVLGAVVFLPFIHIISNYVHLLAQDESFQIAHFQTIYNILCSIIVLPFAGAFGKLIAKIIHKP